MALGRLIKDAMPLLMRERIIDAVLAAQRIAGAPVTAQEARFTKLEPIMRNARAFTVCASRIAQLGSDPQGRTLHRAGNDRDGFALWWISQDALPKGELGTTARAHVDLIRT